eukprot:SAG11_NODE_1756_length_4309_cov_2.250594_2_plen_55_part_00
MVPLAALTAMMAVGDNCCRAQPLRPPFVSHADLRHIILSAFVTYYELRTIVDTC